MYDRVFGLLAREIVRGAETEIEVIVGVPPLAVYIAVAWCAFADEGTCRTQPKRNLGQASAEELEIEPIVSLFYEFECKKHLWSKCLRAICCICTNMCIPTSVVMSVCHRARDASAVYYIFSRLVINMMIMQAGEMTRIAKITSETITDRCVEP